MTKAEACLWKYALRGRKMKGFQFRRQRPVLKYIADFMCKELKLIIEVDGISHHWDEVVVKDKKRQADLENAGFTVLRFTDDEVLNDMNNVIRIIEEWIGDISPITCKKRKIPLAPFKKGGNYSNKHHTIIEQGNRKYIISFNI